MQNGCFHKREHCQHGFTWAGTSGRESREHIKSSAHQRAPSSGTNIWLSSVGIGRRFIVCVLFSLSEDRGSSANKNGTKKQNGVLPTSREWMLEPAFLPPRITPGLPPLTPLFQANNSEVQLSKCFCELYHVMWNHKSCNIVKELFIDTGLSPITIAAPSLLSQMIQRILFQPTSTSIQDGHTTTAFMTNALMECFVGGLFIGTVGF